MCWLLSWDSKLETLKVVDLDVQNQSEVEKLALHFRPLHRSKPYIDKLLIGYPDVMTLVPLMQVA